MTLRLPLLAAALLSAFAMTHAAPAVGAEPAATAVQIQEWTVPWENTRPRDPSVGADGRVWFVGQVGNYLAVFDPESEQFQRFDLPAGTRPHTVLVSPEGEPWVAGNGNGTILRYSAAGELLETIEVADTGSGRPRDPHTFAFDGRGGLWMTMQNGNEIAHLDGERRLRRVEVPTPQARPYGIVADAQGDAWAVLFGVAKLAHVKRNDLALREVELPRPLARPRRLALGADGAVWYVDFAGDHLGRHDLASGATREWPLTPRPAAPYAMNADAQGRLWFFLAGQQPNLLQGFDPRSGAFLPAVHVPSGGITVRHSEYLASENAIWFGTDANTLGRAVLPE